MSVSFSFNCFLITTILLVFAVSLAGVGFLVSSREIVPVTLDSYVRLDPPPELITQLGKPLKRFEYVPTEQPPVIFFKILSAGRNEQSAGQSVRIINCPRFDKVTQIPEGSWKRDGEDLCTEGFESISVACVYGELVLEFEQSPGAGIIQVIAPGLYDKLDLYAPVTGSVRITLRPASVLHRYQLTLSYKDYWTSYLSVPGETRNFIHRLYVGTFPAHIRYADTSFATISDYYADFPWVDRARIPPQRTQIRLLGISWQGCILGSFTVLAAAGWFVRRNQKRFLPCVHILYENRCYILSALVVFQLIAGCAGISVNNLFQLLDSMPDSQGYILYAQYLYGDTMHPQSGSMQFILSLRPILYPLILVGSRMLHDFLSAITLMDLKPYIPHYGFIIFVQLTMWISSLCIVVIISKRLMVSQKFIWIAYSFLVTLIAPIFFVFHALTETSYIFFNAISLLVLVILMQSYSHIKFIFLILTLALLALIRTNGIYFALMTLFGLAFLFRIPYRTVLLSFLILMASLFAHCSYIREFKFSNVENVNITYCFVPRLLSIETGKSLPIGIGRSLQDSEVLSKDQYRLLQDNPKQFLLQYLLQKPGVVLCTLYLNWKANFWDTEPKYPLTPEKRPVPILQVIGKYQNRIVSTAGLFLSIGVIFYLAIYMIRGNQFRNTLKKYLVQFYLSIVILYHMLTSLLVHTQGERFAMVIYLPSFLLGVIVISQITNFMQSIDSERRRAYPEKQGFPPASPSEPEAIV